jgi:hypothetical protein
VVAHIFSYEDLGLFALVRRFAAARLNADRVNAVGVAAFAEYGPDDLLARARQHLQPSGLSARFGGQIALTDGLIHHQDIRRALALPREVPLDPRAGGAAVRTRNTAHRRPQTHPGATTDRDRLGLEHR